MGYRGKTVEQEKARDLRARGWTIKEIAAELSVSQSSVSIWVRNVDVDSAKWNEHVAARRNYGWEKRRENLEIRWAERAKADRLRAEALLGDITERDLFIAGIALYAGEGGKTGNGIVFPNSDPRMIATFLAFLRRFFEIDESRLRVRLYLHEGLDLEAATRFWSEVCDIPIGQFGKP